LPSYNETVADRIPHARSTKVAGCGHLAFIERPEPINQAIEEFLDPLR
jgi:pimeloyl-ACP methyl ester carboxylesterase